MNRLSSVALCAVLFSASLVGGHDAIDQMPLGYVKYPYQAVYTGDNEGKSYCLSL